MKTETSIESTENIGEEEQEKKTKPVMSIILMAKPQIDENYRKKLNGMKGKKRGDEGAAYGVSGGRQKKIDIPVKETRPPTSDFIDEPSDLDLD